MSSTTLCAGHCDLSPYIKIVQDMTNAPLNIGHLFWAAGPRFYHFSWQCINWLVDVHFNFHKFKSNFSLEASASRLNAWGVTQLWQFLLSSLPPPSPLPVFANVATTLMIASLLPIFHTGRSQRQSLFHHSWTFACCGPDNPNVTAVLSELESLPTGHV